MEEPSIMEMPTDKHEDFFHCPTCGHDGFVTGGTKYIEGRRDGVKYLECERCGYKTDTAIIGDVEFITLRTKIRNQPPIEIKFEFAKKADSKDNAQASL